MAFSRPAKSLATCFPSRSASRLTGSPTKMHHHPDHVVYTLNGGKGKMTSGGKTNESEIKTGSVFFLDAQDHEFENIGKTTYEALVVELKKIIP